MTYPPCAGQWKLFDSVDLFDHQRARAMCQTCPLIDACRSRLNLARDEQHANYGPQGTWAGELVGGLSRQACRDKEVIAAQEESYTPNEVRRAHAAYNRGDRDEWALIGHRIYERQRNRKRREKAAA